MAARRAWVSVPSQYKCDRTFLRNVYEAIWLPIADFYLKCETEGDYRSSYARLPPHGHWYEQETNRHGIMYEAYMQLSTGLYISLDDVDAAINSLEVNRRWFPKVEDWVKKLQIPPALCIPISPTRWAFGTELANGHDPVRKERLNKMAKYETCLLLVRQ